MATTIDERLANELARRFRPEVASGMEMRLRLQTPETHVDLEINDGRLNIDRNGTGSADVTFFFDSAQCAWDLMTGRANAIEAFMHGKFRADGYLMMTFRLMAMFDSVSLPPTPND